MRKIFTAVLSTALATTLALGSIACSSETQLSFTDAWNNGVSSNHKSIVETLTYSVTHVENYNDLITKASDVTSDVLDFHYDEGTYVQQLSASSTLPDTVPNNLSEELYANSLFYHLHTELSIPAYFDAGGEEGPITHTDTVITDAYFLSAGQSFAPIWSKTSVNNTFVTIGSGNNLSATAKVYSYDYIFEYGQKEYKMTSINHTADDYQTEKTFEYSYKTAIDNTQLLFALRNIKLEENVAFKIPTVSPSYGAPKTLAVTHKEKSTYTNTINFVSPDVNFNKEVKISVKNAHFLIDSMRDTGAFHYIKIQDAPTAETTSEVPFRSLITEYSAPVISFGAFKCLGAMVYKLTAVTVEQL